MLMRTDPFRDLDRLTSQMFGTAARPVAMPIDAYRDGDEFVALIDLPGVEPDSIDLTVERNVLTVEAQRSSTGDNGRELLIAERQAGRFSRQLFLGDALDPEQLDASYENGVLRLRIPIAEKAKPRRVAVRSESSQPVIDVTSKSSASEQGSDSPGDRQLAGASNDQ